MCPEFLREATQPADSDKLSKRMETKYIIQSNFPADRDLSPDPV